MLMRTDPFRELDRLTQQLFGINGALARPSVMPMDAWREGDTANISASYDAGVLTLLIPVAEQPSRARSPSARERIGKPSTPGSGRSVRAVPVPDLLLPGRAGLLTDQDRRRVPAAFQPHLEEFLEGADKALLAMDDPWEAFTSYLENLFAVQAGDRGFNDFPSRGFTDNAETERIHDQLCAQIADMLARAQEAGKARPDITQADIVNLIWSNGRIIDATSTTAPTPGGTTCTSCSTPTGPSEHIRSPSHR